MISATNSPSKHHPMARILAKFLKISHTKIWLLASLPIDPKVRFSSPSSSNHQMSVITIEKSRLEKTLDTSEAKIPLRFRAQRRFCQNFNAFAFSVIPRYLSRATGVGASASQRWDSWKVNGVGKIGSLVNATRNIRQNVTSLIEK